MIALINKISEKFYHFVIQQRRSINNIPKASTSASPFANTIDNQLVGSLSPTFPHFCENVLVLGTDIYPPFLIQEETSTYKIRAWRLNSASNHFSTSLIVRLPNEVPSVLRDSLT